MKDCKLVEDLWPLYIDGELSAESKEFVEEHLKLCSQCKELKQTNMETADFKEMLDVDETLSTSPEKLMMRLKRRFMTTVGFVILAVFVVAIGTWLYSSKSAQQAYNKQIEEEKRVFQEQVMALGEVSPSSAEMVKRLGIAFSVKEAKQNDGSVEVEYEMNWGSDSPVVWMMPDTKWYNNDLLIDASSGKALDMLGGQGSYGKNGNKRNLEARCDNKVNELVLKTTPFYASMKGPEMSFKYDYSGGSKIIDINQKYDFKGVEFLIESLDLSDKEFKVKYRQLTPASEVGVHQLSFAFDDRLGNSWKAGPEVELDVVDVENPKEFSMRAINSPSKHWMLKVDNVIVVIPGINTKISLGEG